MLLPPSKGGGAVFCSICTNVQAAGMEGEALALQPPDDWNLVEYLWDMWIDHLDDIWSYWHCFVCLPTALVLLVF